MSKPYTHISCQAQSLKEKALQWAQDKLKAQGVTYPLPSANLSLEANYDALKRYGELEAHYVKQFLASQNAVSAQSNDTKPTKTDWQSKYYD